MRPFLNVIAMVCALLLIVGTASAVEQQFLTENIHIAAPGAGKAGLEGILVRPATPGRYPLVLINHGSPRSSNDRPGMTPMQWLRQAMEFARRGWAAAAVLRRGYGHSGGGWAEDYRGCANPDYYRAGLTAATDLRSIISELGKRADIDATRVVSVGISAGGFATVALTADPPPGLRVAINFAGGRGSMRPDTVCNEAKLIDAFRKYGRRSRTPMLWVYAENDHFFGRSIVEKFKEAFVAGGGNVELVTPPPFGIDGHNLFSAGISEWTPIVDEFLLRNGLKLRDELLPLPELPNVPPPSQLSQNGRSVFQIYLRSGSHKAFAVSSEGHYGYMTARRTVEEAKSAALKFCREHAKNCDLYSIDDTLAVQKN